MNASSTTPEIARHTSATSAQDSQPDGERVQLRDVSATRATPHAGDQGASLVDESTLAGLPHRPVDPTAADLWVVGAHGGSGESTLARVDDAARWIGPRWAATGHTWPQPPPDAPQTTPETRIRCVLVARTHATGLRAAQHELRRWVSGELDPHLDLLGLVLMADAPGRLPRPLRDLADLVSGGAPRTWQIGWVDAWRTGDAPPRTSLPKSMRRLLEDLTPTEPTAAPPPDQPATDDDTQLPPH